MAINSRINGSKLIIEADLDESPSPSFSGKTLLIVNSGGFQRTDMKFKDKPVSVSLTVTIPNR